MAASPGAAGQVPDLSAETAGPVLAVPGAPPAFHVMPSPPGPNEFLAGISIDGPLAMHDAYRVDKGGKPTFAG